MKTYAEKLKDPRWQRRRLEIMERDNFTCSNCGTNEDTLHVHHALYKKGRQPWEYDDDELVTFCESCHKSAEEIREEILKALIRPMEGNALWEFSKALQQRENVFWMAYIACCFNRNHDCNRTRKRHYEAAARLLGNTLIPIQERIDEFKRLAEEAAE